MIVYPSPFGDLLISAGCGKLRLCDWADSRRLQRHLAALPEEESDSDVELKAALFLDSYFSIESPKVIQSLMDMIQPEPAGTPFRKEVWRHLLRIPFGMTVSYSLLAGEIGSHARAVAGAVAENPISIFIPCHRVIGRDGSLVGYAGGLEAKRGLLELESKVRESSSPVCN